MLKVDYVVSGMIETNCYFVYDEQTKKAIIIDPGLDSKKVVNKIEELKLKPVLLINTHGHFDHITADDIIREKYNKFFFYIRFGYGNKRSRNFV